MKDAFGHQHVGDSIAKCEALRWGIFEDVGHYVRLLQWCEFPKMLLSDSSLSACVKYLDHFASAPPHQVPGEESA